MYMNSNEYDARLQHYNQWLTDPKREFGTLYPGFPEDKTAKAKTAKVATLKTVKAKTVRTKVGGKTKLEQAKELFKANTKLSRENMIGLFMDKLNMTRAGASTYYYNAQK